MTFCDDSAFCPADPFPDAESAWFWCVQATEALYGGARVRAGMGKTPRPCEPVDIHTIIVRLSNQDLLSPSHLKVLATYGRRQETPAIALHAKIWQQAMDRLTPPLQRKGIITS
jgi:hypothetical protein